MRHRFFIDTDKELRVHPRQFTLLVNSMIETSRDFIVTRQQNTISGDTCVLVVGNQLFIQDPNAEEVEL